VPFVLLFQFRDPFHGISPERRRIARDRWLGRPLQHGHSPIERGYQFPQLADESGGSHRHWRPPYGCVCLRDRETFHISPQLVHRQ
jgi:hypothetical protein